MADCGNERMKQILLVSDTEHVSDEENKALVIEKRRITMRGDDWTYMPEDFLRDERGDCLSGYDEVWLFGDSITPQMLALVKQAVESGVKVRRRAYHWKIQPVCKRCRYRTAISNINSEWNNTSCTLEVDHFVKRLSPPIGRWCPHFKKRERGFYGKCTAADEGDGGDGAESGACVGKQTGYGNAVNVQSAPKKRIYDQHE